MRLHTHTTEGKAGLLARKPAFFMSFRLELSESEARLLESHPDIGKLIIATGLFGVTTPAEMQVTVNACVRGQEKATFATLARQAAFEDALKDGCAALKERFTRLETIARGPSVTEF